MIVRVSLLVVLLGLTVAGQAAAQGRGRAGGAAPVPTARAAAPKDVTGDWV